MRSVMFDLEFQGKGQGRNIDVYILVIPDIDSVEISTKITFLSHPHQEILNNG